MATRVFLKDGRLASVDMTPEALTKMKQLAEKHRHSMPIHVQFEDQSWEVVSISQIDINRIYGLFRNTNGHRLSLVK